MKYNFKKLMYARNTFKNIPQEEIDFLKVKLTAMKT